MPTNFARHGVAIDHLLNCIFWITGIVFVTVQLALLIAVMRYRRGQQKRTVWFTKGSVRLEIIWTLIPTLILATLAIANTKVWDNYRYATPTTAPAEILVIGQQFKWNIIYPGKDGIFGRYLIYPKPTDSAWPHTPDDMHHLFVGVPGPSALPYKQAVAAINQFISQPETEYQLGKDFTDSAGADDDVQDALGRTLFVPVDRPVRITLMSRDVIHDLFLPNFRVQLYAIPGTVGSFTFTPTQTTAEMEEPTHRQYSIDELSLLIADAEYRAVADDSVLTPEQLSKLKSVGTTSILAYRPAHLEAICSQLCGIGHSLMKTDIVILSQAEYHRRFE